MQQLKRLMTLSDFQDAYSVSRSAVYREINAGRLKLTKVGRASRIAYIDAETWLLKQRSASATS